MYNLSFILNVKKKYINKNTFWLPQNCFDALRQIQFGFMGILFLNHYINKLWKHSRNLGRMTLSMIYYAELLGILLAYLGRHQETPLLCHLWDMIWTIRMACSSSVLGHKHRPNEPSLISMHNLHLKRACVILNECGNQEFSPLSHISKF